MRQEDYITSIVIKDNLINIGIDDYGQCYYFEYYDSTTHKLETMGCGAYNFNFLEEIYSYFDPKGVEISLYGKELWDEQTEVIKQRWIDKGWSKENPEELEKILEYRNNTDYQLYDFKKLYEDFNKQLLESKDDSDERTTKY